MKKSSIVVLLMITLMFVAFVAGFYIGRNYQNSNILISGVPIQSKPASTPPSPSTTVPATLDETTRQLMILINTATLEEWDKVPNIGEATANKILSHRNTYGDFERPEDLLKVTGIGEKTLGNIIDYFLGRLTNEDSSC